MSTPGPRPTEYFQEQTPNTAPVESPAYWDVFSRSNVVATSTQGDYVVPLDVLSIVLFGCKSRRNLAARSAAKIFSVQERQGWNFRGVLEKTPLDVYRVKAIYSVCMQHFPLQCLETLVLANKEMRTAIDELCRKTKTNLPMERENYGVGSLVWLACCVNFFLFGAPLYCFQL